MSNGIIEYTLYASYFSVLYDFAGDIAFHVSVILCIFVFSGG